MHVERHVVARARKHFCHWKAKMCSLSIVVGLHVAVNNRKPLSVAMKMQESVPLALLSSYKVFRIAVNNVHVLRSSCKVPDTVVTF
jgi:hypothetical protein